METTKTSLASTRSELSSTKSVIADLTAKLNSKKKSLFQYEKKILIQI